ncbi:MAG: NAD(P)/FAD-dependent oxidoreductase [Actinomycetota bacterium]
MPVDYTRDLPRGADLVVIGGGIAGAATAFHASRAGLRPVILERRPAVCTFTTAVAAGGFRLQLDDEEEYRLISESVDLFLNFEEVTGQREYGPDARQQGYLWATTEEERARIQRRLVETQRGWGLDGVEVLEGEEARRRFPFLGPDVIQARFRAADGLIDPKGLTLGLAAASGAAVVPRCDVTGFRLESGRLAAVETSLGRVDTDVAVIAAGPFSGVVALTAGVELPVATVVRQKLVMPEVPAVPPDSPMTIDDDSGAHWRPALRGASLLFTDPATPPTDPMEEVPTDSRFAFRLLDPESPVSAARVVPFWREVWERGRAPWLLQAGQYTETPDRRPLIGGTAVQGLYVDAGYGGRGVMGSPAGSRILVDLITGKMSEAENPYRLDRSFEERPRLDPL